MRSAFGVLFMTIAFNVAHAAEFEIEDNNAGRLRITQGDRQVAEYVYQDSTIPRPYFANVHAPGGGQITRTHPPDPTQDVADHPPFHPGIWLSFGDLSGNDYWRNSAKTEFVEFISTPKQVEGGISFAARFRYLDKTDLAKVVCEEIFDCRILSQAQGTLIVWDSIFSSDHEFVFGDQEEMGLGIRMASPLRSEPQARGDVAPGSGTILDAEGRKNGAEVWGNAAPWCDYSGKIDGQALGTTIFCHPENFRPSWFHARDYGLLVANTFGQKAFRKGDASRIIVKPGDELRLRYGILLHAGDQLNLEEAYREYVNISSTEN